MKQILNREISLKEIKEHIRIISKKKSPGVDKITNEMLKQLDEDNLKIILEIFNNQIKTGRIESSFIEGQVILLQKGNDSDKTHPENYRPINLLNCLYKLFQSILKERI